MQSNITSAELLRSVSEDLGRYLQTLSPDDWYQPVPLEHWEVRDVAIHLTERVLGFFTETMSRGVQGDTSPPPGFSFDGVVDYASRRKDMAERAIARRERMTDDLANQFSEARNRLMAEPLSG